MIGIGAIHWFVAIAPTIGWKYISILESYDPLAIGISDVSPTGGNGHGGSGDPSVTGKIQSEGW